MRLQAKLGRSKTWAVLGTLLMPFLATAARAQQKDFYLHDGDTIVFYGDSITEQGLYTADVDLYARTRFPQMKLRFFTAGIGGDRVTGGFAGGVDERLQRDVFPHKPTVVTVMLGMNDAGYKALTPDTIATYTNGYEHILQSIRQNLPQARITLLGTSPYDEATRPALVPGGYNQALLKLTAINQALATKYGALYIDLNTPVVDALTKGNADNPLATEMLIPDRIHPQQALHWIMAAAILKGWGANALVTSVAMDAAGPRITNTESATVTELQRDGSGIKWQEMDRALPLPLNSQVADLSFMMKHSSVEQDLNQEPLKITSLPSGSYSLSIDGTVVGTANRRAVAGRRKPGPMEDTDARAGAGCGVPHPGLRSHAACSHASAGTRS